MYYSKKCFHHLWLTPRTTRSSPIIESLCCVKALQQPGHSALSIPKRSSKLPRGLSCSEHTQSLISVTDQCLVKAFPNSIQLLMLPQ